MIKFLNIFILLVSGLLITLVSAFFSIKGFVLFLPDKELLYGILGIGIGFELAKIVMSTFLFHRMKDGNFPIFIKLIMGISVTLLILFSSIFTFVHLNATASQDLSVNKIQAVQVDRILERNVILEDRILSINNEISLINGSDKPNTKLRIYNALAPEKEKLETELGENLDKLNTLELDSVTNNQYTVLESISEFTGYDKKDIFTYIVLFIVIIIDPLAISLFLAGSYIIAEKNTILPRKERMSILKNRISSNLNLLSSEPLKFVDSSPVKSNNYNEVTVKTPKLTKTKKETWDTQTKVESTEEPTKILKDIKISKNSVIPQVYVPDIKPPAFLVKKLKVKTK